MNVFRRMSDIISSNVNSALDKMEDPKKMINLMIDKMEETSVSIRASIAEKLAALTTLDRQIKEAEEAAGRWAERAKLALKKENDELAYEGQDWDFFFWCRDLTPPLSGRDYSYITLNANERQTPQRQEQAFAELLEFLVELCGDNQNLYVDVLHQLRYNQERFQSAVDQAKRVLPGRLCTYRGLKGSLELTVNGRLLFIPRQKRKAPAKISDTDMIRQLWIIEDGKAGEYLCLD